MKRSLVLYFAIAFSFVYAVEGKTGPDAFIPPPVQCYLVINADTGDIILQHHPHQHHTPASLTKLMTLYITLDEIQSGRLGWETVYSVPKWISSIGGSEARMWHGERITVRDLVKAAAVGSANDAAAALADMISHSQDAFVQKMNQKAKELGLHNTFFRSAHGLPIKPGTAKDYTTAADLAKLTLFIMRNHPELFQYTGSKEVYIRKGKYRFNNTNKLIGKYSGINGLKTGFTNDAGFCLVATAKQGNLRVISVLLGAKSNKERFEYSRRLLDYAFSRFTNVSISCKGKPFDVPVPKSRDHFAVGIVRDNLFFMAPKDQSSHIRMELFISKNLEAPVSKGDKIAEYTATIDGEPIARTDVVAEKDIEKMGFLRRFFGN